jgi:hypothetical protein
MYSADLCAGNLKTKGSTADVIAQQIYVISSRNNMELQQSFEVLMAVNITVSGFWDAATCSLVYNPSMLLRTSTYVYRIEKSVDG